MLVWLLVRRRAWWTAAWVVTAVVLIGPLTTLLKDFFGRVRPQFAEGGARLTSLSYPSGHSLRASPRWSPSRWCSPGRCWPAAPATGRWRHEGEFVCILGHSGCGKSTVLSIIAGLQQATLGGVVIDGRQVIGPGADRSVVFQAPCLLPWLTARQNVELAMNRAEHPKWARAAAADTYLELVGIADCADQLPGALSLGTQQRVLLARVGSLRGALGGAGYIEDTGLPQLLRDAQVFPIWEGTTNVLSLNVLRVLDAQGFDALVTAADALLADAGDDRHGVRASLVAAREWHAARAHQRDLLEGGARGLALTLARALAAALAARHAAWMEREHGDASSRAMLSTFATHGLPRLAG